MNYSKDDTHCSSKAGFTHALTNKTLLIKGWFHTRTDKQETDFQPVKNTLTAEIRSESKIKT